MTNDLEKKQESLQYVFEYHQLTKHAPDGYAKGPGYLEWSSQPNPFRHYEGAPFIPLSKGVKEGPRYDEVFSPKKIASAQVNFQNISQFFYQSLALSAWKKAGDISWALRVNPSSGNLHPTEGHMICGPVDGLGDKPMVTHYAPQDHGLEVRAEFEDSAWQKLCEDFPQDTFFVALTSIH